MPSLGVLGAVSNRVDVLDEHPLDSVVIFGVDGAVRSPPETTLPVQAEPPAEEGAPLPIVVAAVALPIRFM